MREESNKKSLNRYMEAMEASGIADVSAEAVALFVSGSPEGVSAALLQKLSAEAAFILAVDSGANQLARAGITPDLLLGDFDSIDSNVLEQFEAEQVATQGYNALKNATDVELGLEELLTRGYRRILASNVLGGRTDHALGSLAAFAGAAAQGIEVVVRDNKEIAYFISPVAGIPVRTLTFSGEPPADLSAMLLQSPPLPAQLSLISWGGPTTVSVKGAQWPLDHFELSPYSARGISNVVAEPSVQLEVHGGTGITIMLLTL